MENQKIKTVFDHVIDKNILNFKSNTLPMIANIVHKIDKKNIDIETELRGTNRPLSKCNKN